MFYFGFLSLQINSLCNNLISCTKLSEIDTTDVVYTGFDATNDLNTRILPARDSHAVSRCLTMHNSQKPNLDNYPY